MAFCTINGLEIPIADASAGVSTDMFGRYPRGQTGTAHPSLLTTKKVWNLKTPPVPKDDHLAYKGLVSGTGHTIPCQNNLYTADGMSAIKNATDTVEFVQKVNDKLVASMWFDGGLYWVEFGPITSNGWHWPVGYSASQQWTALWVTNNSTYNGSDLFCRTGDGDYSDANGYINGSVATASAANGLQNIAIWPMPVVRSLAIYNVLGSQVYHKQYKEIVVLPYKLTVAQRIAATTRTKRWSNLPELTLSGDIVDNKEVRVFGTAGSSDFLQVADSSSPLYNTLSFTLQER